MGVGDQSCIKHKAGNCPECLTRRFVVHVNKTITIGTQVVVDAATAEEAEVIGACEANTLPLGAWRPEADEPAMVVSVETQTQQTNEFGD